MILWASFTDKMFTLKHISLNLSPNRTQDPLGIHLTFTIQLASRRHTGCQMYAEWDKCAVRERSLVT